MVDSSSFMAGGLVVVAVAVAVKNALVVKRLSQLNLSGYEP
jgi:hypothetical protein